MSFSIFFVIMAIVSTANVIYSFNSNEDDYVILGSIAFAVFWALLTGMSFVGIQV